MAFVSSEASDGKMGLLDDGQRIRQKLESQWPWPLERPEFFKTQGTNGLQVWIGPLINIPKGFSSKMTLEVAKIGLKVSTQCML